MITDEILAKALSAVRGIKVTNAGGYNVSPADTVRAALTAALPMIRGAVVEECASVCQTWADAVRAKAPRSPAIIQAEMHAAAIRALKD